MRKKTTINLSTNKALREFYGTYNQLYYGSRLPRNAIVRFGRVAPKDASYVEFSGTGDDRTAEIVVDEYLKGRDCIVAWLVVHEMSHLDVTISHPRVEHGPRFQRRQLDLAKAGGLEGIW